MTKENRDKLDIAAYIRGDISAEDEAVFEALIREDTDFAAEVAFQKTLRETLRSDAPPKQDTAFGWARLSKAIDEETPSSALPVPANDRGPRVKVWRYAAIALACVVFGQAYVIGSTHSDDKTDKYFMAGNIEVQSSTILKPANSARLSSITEFLSENNAMITMGPDEDGQYEISFQSLEACEITLKDLGKAGRNFEMTTGCEEK